MDEGWRSMEAAGGSRSGGNSGTSGDGGCQLAPYGSLSPRRSTHLQPHFRHATVGAAGGSCSRSAPRKVAAGCWLPLEAWPEDQLRSVDPRWG